MNTTNLWNIISFNIKKAPLDASVNPIPQSTTNSVGDGLKSQQMTDLIKANVEKPNGERNNFVLGNSNSYTYSYWLDWTKSKYYAMAFST